MVDKEGMIVGDDDEAKASRLLNAGYLVGHAAGDTTIDQIHDCDHWRLVAIPLELRLAEGKTTILLGDHHELEQTVLYIGYSRLFRQRTQLYIRHQVHTTSFDP